MRIAGFRLYAFREGRLRSIVHQYQWERGINRSVQCDKVSPIFSDDPVLVHPATLCRCGFHAFYEETNPELVSYHGAWASRMVAVIVGTGRVVLHQTGWRAQNAEIVGVVSSGDKLIDNVIRNVYDVPICQMLGVRALAEKFGIIGQNLDLPTVEQASERHWGVA